MNLVVSADNNREILVFPLLPRDLKPQSSSNNEEFKTINNGTLNIISDLGLKTLSIESTFLKKKERWAKAGSVEGQKYVDFFNKWRGKGVPIRVILSTKDGREVLNMACSIEIFDYCYDRVENIKYSLNLKEYRFIRGV